MSDVTYLHPIEAVTDRLSEIGIKDGNIIFDIVSKKILFDSVNGVRTEFNSVKLIDTESELLSSTGIPNNIYVARDTNAIYTYDNGSWISLTISSKKLTENTFYISAESGDDNNNGLSIDSPMTSVNSVLNKYANSSVYIINVIGNVSEGTISITNKKCVTLIGSDSTPVTLTSTNVSIENSSFKIQNITISSDVVINNSRGTIKTSTISGILLSSNSTILLSELSSSSNIVCNDNSMITIRDSNIESLVLSNGSIVSVDSNTTLNNYTISDYTAKLNLAEYETDISTYNFIGNKVDQLSSSITSVIVDLTNAKTELTTNINTVSDNLDTAKTDLTKSINDTNTELTTTIETVSDNRDTAKTELTTSINNTKADLTKSINNTKTELTTSIEAVEDNSITGITCSDNTLTLTKGDNTTSKVSLVGKTTTSKSFTISTSSWTSETNGDYSYIATISVSDITSSDIADVVFDISSLSVCQEAKIAPVCETISGYVKVFSKEVPTDSISGYINIYKV